MTNKTIMIMAGGTGGHIMPGLAIANEMRNRGWNVLWLGHPDRMEGQLVPVHGFKLEALKFDGVRGKGIAALIKLPFRLMCACVQAWKVMTRTRPDVVLGMGGYVAFPGGLVSFIKRIPLVIHEQNAVAGTANRYLAKIAKTVIAGFPASLRGAVVLGNPVRSDLSSLRPITERYSDRNDALRVLVIGGSLGAMVLNKVLPEAIALINTDKRPQIWHQSGEQHISSLESDYRTYGVQARTDAFIDDMAEAYSWADVVVCRAGAMTVSELAVAGVAALFIPLPHAIDDHQTANAKYLSECGGAWLCKQSEFTAEWLAQWLQGLSRSKLQEVASHAQQHAMPSATRLIADACEQSIRGRL